MDRHRNTRIKNFQRRAAYAPETVYRHRSNGWSYIPVHHFADEVDGDVSGVDCWCFLGSDAALLECGVSDEIEKQGLYARVDGDTPYWPKLHAILRGPLTRAAVEDAMTRFVELGFPDGLLPRLKPGDPARRVDG